MEGPRSSWQRRLTAEPGRVYRRLPAARIPASPPWAAQAGQFQLLMLSRFPALGPGGGPAPCSHPRRLAPLSGHKTQLSWEGLSPAPWGPPDCVWSLHPFQAKFPSLYSRNDATAPRGCRGPEGSGFVSEQMVAGSANGEQRPARELSLPQRQAQLCFGCADSLPGRMVQW